MLFSDCYIQIIILILEDTLMHKKTLFIFRRDLRLEDNVGLIHALECSQIVIPCFIFTPEQIEDNPYRSDHCLQFMIESLEDLSGQLKEKNAKLHLFYGQPEQIVEQCIKELHVDYIVAGRDYTPYSRRRDDKIASTCEKHGLQFALFDDILLNAPEDTVKSDGKPYTIFTPYYNNAFKIPPPPPRKNSHCNYFTEEIHFAGGEALYQKILSNRSSKPILKGGRQAGLKILHSIAHFEDYGQERDFPAKEATTHLSAYLKFTVVSPREVYYTIAKTLGERHELIRALYWRDFFSHIAFFFPHVFGAAFHGKYDKVEWNSDEKLFRLWCEGKTGFPIVDAGMRELNETGFMHNRVRMIVASFLTKDLHIDWRWGEKYFAQQLIDYDPAVNNGNWQWAASTGCDAQPYFRIFNPWNQQEKFDKECRYIKQWIPELRQSSPEAIHNWYKKGFSEYPRPILDHSIESKEALLRYSASRSLEK